MQHKKSLFASLLVSAGVMTGIPAIAGGIETDSIGYDPASTVSTSVLLNTDDQATDSVGTLQSGFNYLGLGTKQQKGLFAGDIEVTGVVRSLTIYRDMQESYTDMINSSKNISFTDYPLSNAGANNTAGYPTLELNLKSKLKNGLSFNVGYSFGHSYTGNVDGNGQSLSNVQNLNFGAQLKTGQVKTSVWAGDNLWTNLSRFTMGAAEYRDNYFERLPWDWYRESFQRYVEYFSLSSNIGAQNLGRSPVQGAVGVIDWLPQQMSFKVIYGRTNRNVVLANSTKGFPSYTQGYRLEKYVFERAVRGKIGVNTYLRRALTDFNSQDVDNNSIVSADFDIKVLVNKKYINFSGEIGASKLENPAITDKGQGFGAVLKTEFDRRAVLWPFSVEFYAIDNNMVSIDGSIINTNTAVRDGGFNTEKIYDNMFFGNMSQEVGQLANNRLGVNLKIEGNYKNFKAQFGYAASQEMEVLVDTITIQHRVNSFSRSRFRPWFQASGPYHRIKGSWLRTFETITITNEDKDGDGSTYLDRNNLGFNTLELFTKYRWKLNKTNEFVFLNFNSYNVVRDGFSIVSLPGDSKTYISLFYEDFTTAFKVNQKLSLVGNVAFEWVTGSTKVDLSPDKEKENDAAEDRVIDQFGAMYAVGVDYDLTRKTSLHFRTKYMTHEDKNFLQDKYSGLESTFELKIFF